VIYEEPCSGPIICEAMLLVKIFILRGGKIIGPIGKMRVLYWSGNFAPLAAIIAVVKLDQTSVRFRVPVMSSFGFSPSLKFLTVLSTFQ
jgi:hypothetical protein